MYGEKNDDDDDTSAIISGYISCPRAPHDFSVFREGVGFEKNAWKTL